MVNRCRSLIRLRGRGFGVLSIVHRGASGRGSPMALDMKVTCNRDSLVGLTSVTRHGLSLTLKHNNSRIIIERRSRQTHFCNNHAGPVRGHAHIETQVVDRTLRRLVARTSRIFMVKRSGPSVSSLKTYLKVEEVTRVGNRRY